MDALVFAVGRGARLRPYTDETPKPLLSACRAVDRAATGEYELADALESLVADGRRYVGVELEGWHLNVNTPDDLERARRRFGNAD